MTSTDEQTDTVQEAAILIVKAGKLLSSRTSEVFSDPADTTMRLHPLAEAVRHLVAARHALQSIGGHERYRPLPT